MPLLHIQTFELEARLNVSSMKKIGQILLNQVQACPFSSTAKTLHFFGNFHFFDIFYQYLYAAPSRLYYQKISLAYICLHFDSV